MKSEPDVFSIDDLAKMPNQTEHWDGALHACLCRGAAGFAFCITALGCPCPCSPPACSRLVPCSCGAGVRSHQAKGVMRAMRVGDRAFFYHSNAKPPGIVGIVEVRSAGPHRACRRVQQRLMRSRAAAAWAAVMA